MRRFLAPVAAGLAVLLLAVNVQGAQPNGKSNSGSNGCDQSYDRSNQHSNACKKNPNTVETLICVMWYGNEIYGIMTRANHPITDEPAYNDAGWQNGDIVTFSDGSTCLVAEPKPPVGRD